MPALTTQLARLFAHPFESTDERAAFEQFFREGGAIPTMMMCLLALTVLILAYVGTGLFGSTEQNWFGSEQRYRVMHIGIVGTLMALMLLVWHYWRQYWQVIAYGVLIIGLSFSPVQTFLFCQTDGPWRWLAAYFVSIAALFGLLRLPLLPMVGGSVVSSVLVLTCLSQSHQISGLMIGLTVGTHVLGIALWSSNRWRDRQHFVQRRINDRSAEQGRVAIDHARATRRSLIHDIRQPMAALSLQLGLIQRRVHRDRALSDEVQTLGFAFDALQGQVDEFAREEQLSPDTYASSEIAIQQVEVHEVARMMVQLHQPIADSAGISLQLFCAHNTADYVGMSNINQLTRILQSLLSNAIWCNSHAPQAGKPVRIRVTCRVRGNLYLIHVGDNGCGVDREIAQQVFEPGVSTGDGAGLGLYGVRRAVDDLPDHMLQWRSRPGHYTMFQLALPARRVNRPRTLSRALNDTQVLVVDDEALVRAAIAKVLESEGAHVITASSSAEAIEKVQDSEWAIELFVCDYRLKEQTTGLSLVRRLRSQSNINTPAIIVSAYPGDIPDVSAERITVLTKPSGVKELRTHAAHLVHDFRNTAARD